jgi:phage recombination protein Bet
MNGNQQLQTADRTEKAVEFIPFGADTKIKLTVKMVQSFLCVPTRAGHVCSERDAMKFVMLCQAKGLNPWESDCHLIGYDGKDGPTFSLVTAHQAFLKRAELNPEYDGMESGVIIRDADGKILEREGDFFDDGETVVGGWAKVYFKTRKHPIYRRLRLDTFRQSFGVWAKNPEGMIVKCGEADALRSAFPTKCGGLYLQGEIEPGTDMAFRLAKPVPTDPVSIPISNGTHSTPFEPQQAQTAATTTDAPPARQTSPEASQQEKLKVFIEQEGFDWAVFDLWLDGTGNKPEGSEWKSFADVPDDLAKRFLRSRDGLKRGLAGAKGAMSNE